jgi:hypothetical protein
VRGRVDWNHVTPVCWQIAVAYSSRNSLTVERLSASQKNSRRVIIIIIIIIIINIIIVVVVVIITINILRILTLLVLSLLKIWEFHLTVLSLTCEATLRCIWTFSIVTQYKNTTFHKQTAVVCWWNTRLRISNNLNGTKNLQIRMFLLDCYLFLWFYFIWRRKQSPFETLCSYTQWQWKKSKYTSVMLRMLHHCLRIIAYIFIDMLIINLLNPLSFWVSFTILLFLIFDSSQVINFIFFNC